MRGLPGGGHSPAAFVSLHFAPAPPTAEQAVRADAVARTALTEAEGPEHVVIAGGGVVAADDRQQVGPRGPARREAEAAAHTLPVATAPCAAC